MRKPSIFSRDYEKQMKKRKRIIILICILLGLIVGYFIFKIVGNNFNFTQVKDNLQEWIDKDKPKEYEEVEIVKDENQKEQIQKEVKSKFIEINIEEGNVIKLEIDDNQNIVKVEENKKEYSYDVSKDKKTILVLDSKQNIKAFSTKGEEKNYTLTSYTSPDGEVFKKDEVLKNYKSYIWHLSPKFITDDKIAYISNMPYFGIGDNQYIWIYDIKNNKHSTIWQSKGKEIKINNITEKGLEVIIDGNTKLIDNNGNLVQ